MSIQISSLFCFVLANVVTVVTAIQHTGDSYSRRPRRINRSLQVASNEAITEDQFQACLQDVLTADQNGDYELSAAEFIRFITFNSAMYGYTWGYAAGQTAFDQMPLNFPMLFYTQACLCAHEEESFGCCSADNAHVEIYTGPKYGGGITEKQDIYMREFCTEAYHSYSVTLPPTPAPTPKPTTASPTPSPIQITSPPTSSPTPSPTLQPTTEITSPATTFQPTPPPTRTVPQPTTPQPTSSGTTSLLSVPIQYGISSDCGVTAYDVITANRNTVKAGLEAATETIVIQILNATTWPWDSSFRAVNIPKNYGLETNLVVTVNDEEGEEATAELPHLIRYNELVPVTKKSNADEVKVRGIAYMLLNSQKPRRQLLLQKVSKPSKQHSSSSLNTRRNLVYYTGGNVEITDVEDSNEDQACPPGLNCMVVSSVVRVTLEPGDDPDVVREVIEEGLEQSYQDSSFFEAIPGDTILCPVESLAPSMASGGSIVPTPLPSAIATPVSSVESMAPSSIITDGSSTPSTMPTVSLPSMIPTTVTTGVETEAPSTRSSSISMPPSAVASSDELGGESPSYSPSNPQTNSPSVAATLQRLQVTINYDIENQCGLNAEKVMNEDGNTLKSGLIAATTTVAIDTLNATFPRDENQRNMIGLEDNSERDLAYLQFSPDHINRVYYTDQYPVVVIERILDIETGCDPGTNCLLIISTVTVLLEPFDDENAVKNAITDGISESFNDGSFSSAIPSDIVICPPTRGGIKFISPEPTRLRARKR